MIRVFVVDDDPLVRETIRVMLEIEKDMEVVGENDRISGSQELIERARVDVLLLDVQLPDGNGPDLALEAQSFTVVPGVVMISVQKDVSFLREAMKAGARDYLVKPFSAKDLVETIRRVYGEMRHYKSVMGRSLAVWSCRGGAGGTSFSLSLAAAVSRAGHSVVVVDGDLYMGDVAFLSDCHPELTWVDWMRESGSDGPEEYLLKAPSGLDVLAAPRNPAQAELIKTEAAASVTSALRKEYDLIIVDLHRSFDEMTLNLAESCDDVWLFTDLTCTGVKNLKLFRNLLDQLRWSGKNFGLVLNRTGRSDKKVISKLAEKYGLRGVLPLDGDVEKSWIKGKTPVEAFPRSPFVRAVRKIAQDMIEEWNPS